MSTDPPRKVNAGRGISMLPSTPPLAPGPSAALGPMAGPSAAFQHVGAGATLHAVTKPHGQYTAILGSQPHAAPAYYAPAATYAARPAYRAPAATYSAARPAYRAPAATYAAWPAYCAPAATNSAASACPRLPGTFACWLDELLSLSVTSATLMWTWWVLSPPSTSSAIFFYSTRWPAAYPLRDVSARACTAALASSFSVYGVQASLPGQFLYSPSLLPAVFLDASSLNIDVMAVHIV